MTIIGNRIWSQLQNHTEKERRSAQLWKLNQDQGEEKYFFRRKQFKNKKRDKSRCPFLAEGLILLTILFCFVQARSAGLPDIPYTSVQG